jgi:hypothetical protein
MTGLTGQGTLATTSVIAQGVVVKEEIPIRPFW